MEYVVFLSLVPVALVLLSAVCVMAWRRRLLPEGRALVALLVLCMGWVLTSAAEIIVPTPAATFRVAQVEYFFSSFVPVGWLAFAWVFTDRAHRLRSGLFRALVAFELATFLLVLGNAHHTLVWKSVTYVPVGPMLGMKVAHGAWFYAYAAVNWAVIAVASGRILREYSQAYRSTRRMSVLIALGALLPLVLSIAYVAGLMPMQNDYTPLSTSVGAIMMAIGVHRYQLLSYRPVARNVLIDGMREGMLVLDVHDRIVDLNPALQDVLQVPGRLLGRPLAAVLPAGQLQTLAGAARRQDVHTEIALKAGGRERAYDVRISPLTNRRGGASGRLVLLYDVTERRAAERALRAVNAELQARNEDLDAFARTVAHDLKNPIQAIQGFAEIMQDMGAEMSDEMRAECLATILRTSQQMDGIVQALLLLAGVNRQAVTPAPLSMDEVVSRTLARVAPLVARAGASVSAPEAWPAAVGYAPWIEEVWMNYLTNAVKYGGDPARIRIGADAPAGGFVRYWVQDAGPGLPAEACARLFQPFTRVGDLNEEGHGLGLSIVRRITERLGGEAGVESSGVPGAGCLFYFTLPAAAPEADLPAEAALAAVG